MSENHPFTPRVQQPLVNGTAFGVKVFLTVIGGLVLIFLLMHLAGHGMEQPRTLNQLEVATSHNIDESRSCRTKWVWHIVKEAARGIASLQGQRSGDYVRVADNPGAILPGSTDGHTRGNYCYE